MTTPTYHGLLVLDKPDGITSRDAVNRAQRWFPRGTKLGHTGTLDPLATGVLVLCVGAATRLAEYVQQMEKVYLTTFDLSKHSDTADLGGTVIKHYRFVEPHPDRAAIENCLEGFVGEIEQVPPAYSAAKVAGRRAYDLAREKESFSLAPRRVHIHSIELLEYGYPIIKLRVRCGKGTYIRSLATDLGKRLGRAGLVTELRRTAVGPFKQAEGLRLDIDPATARACLLPVEAAVTVLPRVVLSEVEIAALRNGQTVRLPHECVPTESSACGHELAVFNEARRFVAVALVDWTTRRLRPEKVMPGS